MDQLLEQQVLKIKYRKERAVIVNFIDFHFNIN